MCFTGLVPAEYSSGDKTAAARSPRRARVPGTSRCPRLGLSPTGSSRRSASPCAAASPTRPRTPWPAPGRRQRRLHIRYDKLTMTARGKPAAVAVTAWRIGPRARRLRRRPAEMTSFETAPRLVAFAGTLAAAGIPVRTLDASATLVFQPRRTIRGLNRSATPTPRISAVRSWPRPRRRPRQDTAEGRNTPSRTRAPPAAASDAMGAAVVDGRPYRLKTPSGVASAERSAPLDPDHRPHTGSYQGSAQDALATRPDTGSEGRKHHQPGTGTAKP